MDSNVPSAEGQTSDTNESQVLHDVQSGAVPINYDQSQQQCLSNNGPFPQSPEFLPTMTYAREENNAGYGYQFIPRQLTRIPENMYGRQALFLSGNVGYQNDPSFVCNNSPFLNQFSPQYLNSNHEFVRQPHPDFLRQPHPEFLDANTLGLEFSRLKIMHDLYQAQIDAQTEAEGEAQDEVKLEENAPPAGFFQNVPKPLFEIHQTQPGPVPYMMNWNNGNNLFAPYQLGNASKESLEKFQAQQIKFCQLPIEAHRKIQSMPGYEITNIFQVTLVRFLANNLIESPNAFAVFTRSPESGQNWLMAFAVRKDGLRTIIKFNRLLTAHLKVTVIGQTAVELESSRLSKSFMGEQFVFSFTRGEDAKLFLDALSLGRSQVWTCDGHPSNTNSHSSAKLGIWMNRQGIPRFVQENIHGVPVGRSRSGINSAIPSNYFQNGGSHSSSRFNKRNPSYCDERILNSFESRILENSTRPDETPKFPNTVKFSAEVTLFINEAESSSGSVTIDCNGSTGLPYAELGSGVLSMVEKASTFNEIFFTVNKTEVVCDHKIYAWNDFVLDTEKESNTMCSWNGVVSFSKEKNQLPALRQFLVHFDDHEIAKQFFTCFSEARKKASQVVKCQSF